MVTIAKGEIPVGLDLGTHSYEIAPELVRDYCDGTGSDHPWYEWRRSTLRRAGRACAHPPL